jgi:hypothetical protein
MSASQSHLSDYNALPAPARKWVLRVLRDWAGWSRSTVYRKLECDTLCKLENLLLSSVMTAAGCPMSDGQQLIIGFDWSDRAGKMNIRRGN